MSIVRMRKFFRRPIRIRIGRHAFSFGTPVQIVFWGIVIIFVVGAYYSFGPPTRGGREQAGGRKLSQIVARVGKQVIPREKYELALAMSNYEHSGAAMRSFTKLQILDQMIDDLLQLQAAKAEGIKVSGREVTKKREEMVEEAIKFTFPSRKDLVRYLRKKRMTYQEYEDRVRRERFGNLDAIKRQLLVEKLKEKVEGRISVSDEEVKQSFEEVKARHILISPEAEARRAGEAAKKKDAPSEKVDGDALARDKAKRLLERLKKGEDFAALAKQYSDDKGSAERGGDLGWIKRGQMVLEFEKAAFALKPGQVSGVVKSPYGYHIIKVEDKRLEVPDDFEKNKERYRQEELSRRKIRAWQQYMDNLRKQTPIEIVDPELRGYKLAQEGKEEEAIQALEEAVKADPYNVDARYHLAMMYKDRGDKKRAVELLQEAAEIEAGARMADVHMALGELLEDLGRKKEAIEEYQRASEWAIAHDFMNYMLHSQLRSKFEKLGRKDLADAEKKWMDEFDKSQQGQMTIPLGQ